MQREKNPGVPDTGAQNPATTGGLSTIVPPRYDTVAPAYGWGELLPLPAGAKKLPPAGFTGRNGRSVSDADRAGWAGHQGNYALRLPAGVVGIDVDQYGDKAGASTLRALEGRPGALPATWTSTSRDIVSGSGIRLYRYSGQHLRGGAGAGIDVIQREHRYMVVWPSVVEGRAYRWYAPNGEPSPLPPALGQLPALPPAWEAYLTDLPAAHAATGPAADVPEERVREYCGAVVEGLREELAAAAQWPEGRQDARGRGWDALVANAAYRVAGLAATPGSGYDQAAAEAVFRDIVPPAMWETEGYRAADKWRHKVNTAPPIEVPARGVDEVFGLNAPSVPSVPSAALETPTTDGEPDPWAGVELDAFADGTYEPEPATVLLRTDGRGLLYPGKTHAFNGEPESGKSMLAQWAVVVELCAGRPALVLDYESDAGSYVERLRLMGASAEAIKAHLVYVNPPGCPATDPAATAGLERLLNVRAFSLAVLDGVTEALALGGLNSNSGDEVTLWHRWVARRIAKAGAAVVVVDHVVKAAEGRGRFAIGSQAKLAALSGAAYLVDVKRPLGRGVVGELAVKVAKDRPGYVRGIAGRWSAGTRLAEAARVLVDGTMPGRISVTINAPTDDTDDEGNWRPTVLMERISRALEEAGEPLSSNALNEAVTGKKENIRAAAAQLEREGHIRIEQGPNRSTLHTSLRGYREADDPKLAVRRVGADPAEHFERASRGGTHQEVISSPFEWWCGGPPKGGTQGPTHPGGPDPPGPTGPTGAQMDALHVPPAPLPASKFDEKRAQ